MIATFCGNSEHSYSKEEKKYLYNVVEELIKEGFDEFLLGGYGSFDILAAYTVKALKKKYTHIKSVLVIPYIDRDYDKNLYDESVYPPLEFVPKRFAISHRNRWMVNEADAVVSGVRYTFGGSAKTLKYAIGKKKRILHITENNLII